MRAHQRSLWRVEQSGIPTLSALTARKRCIPAARNTSGGVFPGGGVEELQTGITKPQAYRGAERSKRAGGLVPTAGLRRESDPAPAGA